MGSKRSISNEDGWLLIEVVMGAVLVLVVSLGLLSGFDSSSKASSIDKQRSVAASLAQTDQEHMRTYTVAYLSNLRATVPAAQTKIGGVQFTVKERADWVNDNSGIANCTSSDTQGSYIEITSTVTWPGMGTVVPITAQSLVSPPVGSFGPGQGSVGVQLKDGATPANPIPSMPVQLGTGMNDVTDDNGCAVFGYIPSGNYVAQASRSGWVDWGGNSPAKKNCPVPDGSTAICQIVMDVATSANVSFWTQSYNNTDPNNPNQASAQQATFTNPKMNPPAPETQLGGKRAFPPSPGGLTHTLPAPNLFPFSDGYGIYAGSCNSADPTNWKSTPGANIGPGTQINNAGPGQPPYDVRVKVPSLLVKVTDVAGNPITSGTVKISNPDASCGASPVQSNLDSSGQIPPDHTGYPFGTYTICARAVGGTLNGRMVSVTKDNDNIDGTAVPIQIKTSSPVGTCP